MNEKTGRNPRGTRWCAMGSTAVGIGIVIAVIGLFGARVELLPSLFGFMLYAFGTLICLIAIVILLIGLLLSKGSGGATGSGRAWGAFAVGAAVVALGLGQMRSGSDVPPIHDISTDLSEPPAFSDAIRARREQGGAQNPPEHAGDSIAEQQVAAYPDVQTLVMDRPPAAVFTAALALAGEMGWEIVTRNPEAGLIEATATTEWFRFKDDVVIRIRAGDNGSIVDMRSKSRVGQSDMGANAARIREFMERLQAAAA